MIGFFYLLVMHLVRMMFHMMVMFLVNRLVRLGHRRSRHGYQYHNR
jgi:hypothetical protein